MSNADQAGLTWHKSSASGDGADCVEVAMDPELVYLRHSHHGGGPVLAFLHKEWAAFVTGVRNGEFEPPTAPVAAAES